MSSFISQDTTELLPVLSSKGSNSVDPGRLPSVSFFPRHRPQFALFDMKIVAPLPRIPQLFRIFQSLYRRPLGLFPPFLPVFFSCFNLLRILCLFSLFFFFHFLKRVPIVFFTQLSFFSLASLFSILFFLGFFLFRIKSLSGLPAARIFFFFRYSPFVPRSLHVPFGTSPLHS